MGSEGGVSVSSDGTRRLRGIPRAQRHAARLRVRHGLGDRQTVRVDARGSVSRPPAAGHRQSRVHGGVRRSEGRRRLREPHAHGRSNAPGDVVERIRRGLAQPPRSRPRAARSPGPAARGAAVRSAEHEHLRRLRELVRQQVLLQPLAAVHGDPLGGQGRQSGDRAGCAVGQPAPAHVSRFRRTRPRTARSAARP